MRDRVLALSPRYREAIRFSLIQQLPWSLICALILDGGRMARICAISLIAYWTLALVMMSRRPFTPDSRDMAFLRWGFLPLFAVAAILAHSIRPG
jgi:hypothetical protein